MDAHLGTLIQISASEYFFPELRLPHGATAIGEKIAEKPELEWR
jgi:hypothetical protein